MEEMFVPLDHARGSIVDARILYEEVDDEEMPFYVAYIYMGKGPYYAEMQRAFQGSRDISCLYEFETPDDGGPSYVEAGDEMLMQNIESLEDWIAWLCKYARGLDPRDAFRNYREVVGGFR